MNELHRAATVGSTERTLAVLSRGVIDIDQGTSEGMTPLMFAAFCGHSRVVRTLLNKGANVAMVSDGGATALHVSAQAGHLAATKLLVKAGADLEAKLFIDGSTPLILAAQHGHPEVMGMLIEAGANPNSRMLDGATSLYIAAAQHGHMDTTKVLLRAKANPLLTFSSLSGGTCTYVPLDSAVVNGHLEAARELIQEHGIEGCGGASGGIQALQIAAENQHVEMMGMLTRAGVVDTGVALQTAASFGRESSVKFLLHKWKASGQGAAYLKTCDQFGRTPLLCSVEACRSCSPRITRLLVDAGADTTTAVRLKNPRGVVYFYDTPLALTNIIIRGKKIGGEVATEEQLHSLEATRRLLLRVDAVHAVSWLWAGTLSATHAASKGKNKANATPTSLTLVLPILRRRAGRPRVLLAALFRNSKKP